MSPSALLLGFLFRDACLVALGNVWCLTELLKELTFKDIPSTIEPRFSKLWRQCFQLLDVVWLTLKQYFVVCHKALDEGVVLWDLSVIKFPVDEHSLNVLVALAAGVAGVVDSLGEVINATKTGYNGLHLVLRELCSLIQEDDIVFHTLESVQIGVSRTVGKVDDTAIAELQHLVLIVILGDLQKLHAQDVDVVVDKLWVGSTHDQNANTGISESQ